jgi:hypothetical protein
MSAVLYRAMLSKVKALLKVESPHSKDERSAQQWQLLFQIDGTQFIVGKGGVNTTFYTVGDGERKLCYPDELLEFLESLVRKATPVFAIYSKTGKKLKSGILSENDALNEDATVGCYIVGMSNGKKKRLYVRKRGLFDVVWQPFKSK